LLGNVKSGGNPLFHLSLKLTRVRSKFLLAKKKRKGGGKGRFKKSDAEANWHLQTHLV